MGRQGKDFGGQGGERRFEGGPSKYAGKYQEGGRDFKARGPRGNDGPRSNDGPRRFESRGGSEGGRGGDFRDSRPPARSFGSGSGGFERRNNFAGRDDRAPQRPNNYRRPEGAQGGYGRPSAPRYDDAPRARPQAVAPAAPAVAAAPVVSAQQLKNGIGQANRALAEVIEQFGHTLQGDYDIGAIEVTVSFAADGRFLGFGAGGAASMKIQLTPLDAESVMEGQSADEADGDADEDESFADLGDDADDETENEAEDEVDADVVLSKSNGALEGEASAQFDA